MRSGSVRKKIIVSAVLLWASTNVSAQSETAASQEQPTLNASASVDDFLNAPLDSLTSMEVVTASNRKESINEAPATIVVVTEQEIKERGYIELYDVLNDLPGFDFSRAFGDDYMFLYSRGYRKTIGDPMLLMIDGVIMNGLWQNAMLISQHYPLQGVKQIEIVYGPASAVYGPNAMTGVIHIRTKKEGNLLKVTSGRDNTSVYDLSLNQVVGDFHVSLNGRVYQSDGPDLSSRAGPYLSDSVFSDRRLWGPFAGSGLDKYKDQDSHHFLKGEVGYGGLSVGFINWLYQSGYGTEYAGDQALNGTLWKFDEQTYYATYEKNFGSLESRTLLRYRQSGNPGSSLFVYRYGPPETGSVHADYYQFRNHSYSVYQDFTYPVTNTFSTNFGVKFERKDLQKAYVLSSGGDPLSGSTDPYVFPLSLSNSASKDDNRFDLTDMGIYTQTRWNFSKNSTLHGGVRLDHNSFYGAVVNPRLGIVQTLSPNVTGKAFYGTAFLEPSARSLYGGYSGRIANDSLQPEKMKTVEVSLNGAWPAFAAGLSTFYSRGSNGIAVIGSETLNLGERKIYGADVTGSYIASNVPLLSSFKLQGSFSYLKSQEDIRGSGEYSDNTNTAPYKAHAIFTAYPSRYFNVSLQNRWFSSIDTVPTNPIRSIDSYFVTDASINFTDLGIPGVEVGLKAYNLFNERYFQPGYLDGAAGENAFNSEGEFQGSKGFYSSRLVQPGRVFFLGASYKF